MLTFLLVLAAVFIYAPLIAVFQAWTYSTLWGWFVAGDYGAGPSFGAWYGLALIANLVLATALHNVARKKEGEDRSRTAYIVTIFGGTVFAYLLTLGLAYLVGQITGWIA